MSVFSGLPFLFLHEYLGYKDKEQWDKNEIDESGGEHPPANGRTDGVHGAGAGAGGDGQRQDPKKESQGGHDNGPESYFYGAKGCIDKAVAMFQPFFDKLNDQNGVFCRKAKGSEESDLKVDIVGQSAQ
jgi:hypothetical protein